MSERSADENIANNEILAINLDSLEDKLAQKLNLICDEHGRELDIQKSAQILHELAKIYQKRSPDLFSLIKSAALYNAAIARNPENANEIENDLKQLCKHILSQANANQQNADLVAKAKQIKRDIEKMRTEVDLRLQAIKQIPDIAEQNHLKLHEANKIGDVRQLQNDITDNYIHIMADIAAYCDDVMGESSLRFALVGMGSLARKEVTPYSDFENIILLQNSSTLDKDCPEDAINHFRWYSVIFQVILINLQETIIPSVQIFSLNDETSKLGNWFYDSFTTRGISFDGMMPHACKFPLGRQNPTKDKPWKTELIKPVDEMLKYLSSEENLKNGYHLSDILTKTCFIYKDRDVFTEFQNGVFQKLESDVNDICALEAIKKQVADDLGNFAMRPVILELKSKTKFNVKQVVYRSTTLFVSALGRICNIHVASCFDVVEELAKKNIISEYANHKIMYAVALACEIRLRWYSEHKKQNDMISNDLDHEVNPLTKLLKIVGKSSTISYFQIAYALQCDISKRLNLSKNHFYTNPSLLNSNLGHCFDDEEHLFKFLLQQENAGLSHERFYNFDDCLKTIETQLTFPSIHIKQINCANEIKHLGIKLLNMGFYDDALECFQIFEARSHALVTSENFCKSSEQTISYDENGFFLTGYTLYHMGEHDEALKCFQMALRVFAGNHMEKDSDQKHQNAVTYRQMGCCCIFMGKTNKAMTFLEKSLQIQQTTENNDKELVLTLYWMGHCLLEMHEHDEALYYLMKGLHIQEKLMDIHNESLHLKNQLLYCIGHCFFNLNNMDDAIEFWQMSLNVKKQIVSNDISTASTLYWIGRCFVKRNEPNTAINYLKKTLEIKKRISLDISSDNGVAVTLYWIGHGYRKLKELSEAINCFQNSLKIFSKISSDISTDASVAAAMYNIGRCLKDENKPDEAIPQLKTSLEIKENIATNKDIADTLHTIGICFLDLNKPNEAMPIFERSLSIRQQISNNIKTEKSIASSLYWISCCLQYLGRTDASETYKVYSLEITKFLVIPKLT